MSTANILSVFKKKKKFLNLTPYILLHFYKELVKNKVENLYLEKKVIDERDGMKNAIP